MVRQRKCDEKQSASAAASGGDDDSGRGRATENMQYVNNSRSKVRLLHLAPSPGFLKWLFMLRITRFLVIVTITVVFGFMCGRAVHWSLLPGSGEYGSFEIAKDQRSDLGDVDKRDSELKTVSQKRIGETVQHHHTPGSQYHQDQRSNLNLQVGKQIQNEAHRQPDTRPLQQDMQEPQQNKEGIMQQHVQQPVLPHVPINPNEPVQHPQAIKPADEQQLSNNNLNAVKDAQSDNEMFPYHIIQTLTNVHKLPHLKTRFVECTKSILSKASINLHFFFVVDAQSREFVMQSLQDITDQQIALKEFQFNFIDVDQLAHQLAPLVSMLQEKVTHGHPYYQDAIFFLSVAIHHGILPSYVHRIVMLDTDLKFMTDIKQLFEQFNHFTSTNVMAMAREMQPVYRHLLSLYRNQNKGTKVGDPPADGQTGFNSGVMLLDLDKMRSSTIYHSYINADRVHELASKYSFKGHLGDQDFYTLISLDQPNLFHILPCSWNRQLCTWWRDKGYSNVFDQYYRCDGEIHVYHGNCNTPIPF